MKRIESRWSTSEPAFNSVRAVVKTMTENATAGFPRMAFFTVFEKALKLIVVLGFTIPAWTDEPLKEWATACREQNIAEYVHLPYLTRRKDALAAIMKAKAETAAEAKTANAKARADAKAKTDAQNKTKGEARCKEHAKGKGKIENKAKDKNKGKTKSAATGIAWTQSKLAHTIRRFRADQKLSSLERNPQGPRGLSFAFPNLKSEPRCAVCLCSTDFRVTGEDGRSLEDVAIIKKLWCLSCAEVEATIVIEDLKWRAGGRMKGLFSAVKLTFRAHASKMWRTSETVG